MSASIANLGDAPTPREAQVAVALLFGHSVKQTAADLGIAPATVACHRERLHAKFGTRGVADLAATLMRSAAE